MVLALLQQGMNSTDARCEMSHLTLNVYEHYLVEVEIKQTRKKPSQLLDAVSCLRSRQFPVQRLHKKFLHMPRLA